MEERSRDGFRVSRSTYVTGCSILVGIGFFYVLYLTHLDVNKENGCQMTYMWKRISMIPVTVENNTVSSYGLYRYHEGPRDNVFVSTPETIPVLFIPGSGGSAAQVRSMASVMLNKTLLRNLPYSYHFYAADFNEELSFLSGVTLDRQRNFVVQCIEKIFQIYETDSFSIDKLVLVGHSFGGTVAVSLPIHPRFDARKVDLIITISSPLAMPPVNTDSSLFKFYSDLKKLWKEGDALSHIGIVAYSGGVKDFQVPDRLADSSSLLPFEDAPFLPSWSIPRVNLDADHLCALWCNQLVRHQTRLLEAYGRAWNTKAIGRDVVKEFYSKLLKDRRSVIRPSASRSVLRGFLWPWTSESMIMKAAELPVLHSFDVRLDSVDSVLVADFSFNRCTAPKVYFRFASGARRYAGKIKNNKLIFRVMETMGDSAKGLRGELAVQVEPGCSYTVVLYTDFWWGIYMLLLNSSNLLPSILLDALLFSAAVRQATDRGITPRKIMLITNIGLAAFLAWSSQSQEGYRLLQVYIRILFVVLLSIFTLGDPFRNATTVVLGYLSRFIPARVALKFGCATVLLGSFVNLHAALSLMLLIHAMRSRCSPLFLCCILCAVISGAIALAGGIRQSVSIENPYLFLSSPVTAPLFVAVISTCFKLPQYLATIDSLNNAWILFPICSTAFMLISRQVPLELYCAFVVVCVPLYEVFADGQIRKKKMASVEKSVDLDDVDTPLYPRPAHLRNMKKEL